MKQTRGALPPDYRWNFFAFVTDYVFFGVAFSFASPSSVLPAFVRQLTRSALVIGLVSTVFNGSWLLPQLAVARLVNDKPRKKPYLLGGLSGRITFWMIALALWLGLGDHASKMLVLFFVCLGLFAVTDGVASVAWFDMLARAIPLKRRGRLMGISQVISGVAGLGVGLVVSLILDSPVYPFPTNYALIFALAGVAFVPSTIALILIREPSPGGPTSGAQKQGRGGWLAPLTGDSPFRRLMLCRVMVGMVGLATPFYVVHATDVLALPEAAIGSFVAAQKVASVASGAALGLVSDRWGPRHTVRIGSGIAIAGPLFALVAHLADGALLTRAYPIVYLALGITQSAGMLGFYNYLLEIAPDDIRPSYVGLGNTIMGVLTLAPTVGGWLLEATSYGTLFGLTSALVAVGFLLTLGLRPPTEVASEESRL